MSKSGKFDTSTSLLRKLSQDPPNETAWNTFVDRYGRLIYGWARRWGLSSADAEDLTQNVLLDIARQMRDFRYDPRLRFRGWLHTLTYRKWQRFLSTRRNMKQDQDVFLAETVLSSEAHADFLSRLQIDCEHELLAISKEKVRQRVAPKTWEAFRLTAIEELSGAEVADRLDMKVGSVFVARSKVQRMIQEEFKKLHENND
jgi:RNA polymerase sigma-70 factor (ECF subfamily)